MKFIVPKLKYKGKTVQFQRVRAKKNPKIEQLDSKILTEEEQKEIQERSFSKIAEENVVKQQTPNWKLYWVDNSLSKQLHDSEWWSSQILLDTLDLLPDPNAEEEEDEDEEISNFLDDINLKAEAIEEFDGLNEDFSYFVVIVNLELLMRGHAICITTQDRKINIDVPSLYSLTVNLPIIFDKEKSKSFFDCKRRVLWIVLPLGGLDEKTIHENTPESEGKIEESKENLIDLSDNLEMF